MSYSTIKEVRQITGMTQKDENNEYLVGDAFIQLHIDQADSIIDAYIGDAYILPLPSDIALLPGLIRSASIQISAALLYMATYGEETQDVDKGGRVSYNHWTKELKKVQKGELKLYSNGEELPTNDLFEMSGYPNNTSNEDKYNSTKERFAMDQINEL